MEDNMNKPLSEQELLEAFQNANMQEASSEIPDRMQQARDERDRLNLYGNLLSGFQQIVTAPSDARPDYTVANNLRRQGEQVVQDAQVDAASERRAKQDEMQQEKFNKEIEQISLNLQKSKLDFQDAEATRDPNSPQSKFAQDAYIQMQKSMGQPVNEDSVRAASAHEIYSVSPWMQKMYSNQLRAEMDKARMAQQDKRIKQAERRLDLMGEREQGKQQRFDRSQDFKEAEKQEISDKQTETLNTFDTGQNIIDEIRNKFQLKNVQDGLGVYASKAEEAKKYIPFVERDPDFVETQALVGTQLADYVKQISGAAVSEQEAQRLARNIPSMDDKPGEFKRKLDTFERILNKNRQTTIESFEKQGKDPGAFKDESQQQAPEKVRVRNLQSGEVGSIPRKNLQKALDSGRFEVVE